MTHDHSQFSPPSRFNEHHTVLVTWVAKASPDSGCNRPSTLLGSENTHVCRVRFLGHFYIFFKTVYLYCYPILDSSDDVTSTKPTVSPDEPTQLSSTATAVSVHSTQPPPRLRNVRMEPWLHAHVPQERAIFNR